MVDSGVVEAESLRKRTPFFSYTHSRRWGSPVKFLSPVRKALKDAPARRVAVKAAKVLLMFARFGLRRVASGQIFVRRLPARQVNQFVGLKATPLC